MELLKKLLRSARAAGYKVSQAHLRYINPLPKNTKNVLHNFKKILIPEINLGQLAKIIKSEFLIDVEQFNLVQRITIKNTGYIGKDNRINSEEVMAN